MNAPSEKESASGDLTADDIASVEKISDLSYTGPERAMILDGMEMRLDRLRQRRAEVTLANTDAPALTFDPRLPSVHYPDQENRVALQTARATPLPDDDAAIAFAAIVDQGRWLRDGSLTSARLTDIYLDRITRIAPGLECFVTVTADLARAEAARADTELAAGTDRGPLHGIPYGLKDLADTKGISTTWGAEPFKDRIAEDDAVIVTRLREAGAVLLGKTTLGALAMGDVWFGGITRNPWNTAEGSSGSSAGSASATVAGLCSFAIGTETLGSIVSPAARCGATGLRPTFGRIPRTGAMALCWSLDKIGPICRFVADTALVLTAINGFDVDDASSLDHGFSYDRAADTRPYRIGYKPGWFNNKYANDTDRAALAAARDAGHELVEIALPDLPYRSLIAILETEAAAAFEDLTLTGDDDLLKWQEPHAWPNTFRAARTYTAIEHIQLDRFRRKVMKMMDGVFNDVDLILSPNFAGNLLMITNFTGHPSLTLPAGFVTRPSEPLTGVETGTGATPGPEMHVPHTVTLWGPLFEERRLLAVGEQLQEMLGTAEEHPAL